VVDLVLKTVLTIDGAPQSDHALPVLVRAALVGNGRLGRLLIVLSRSRLSTATTRPGAFV
jgi:hypothetical protein